MMRLSGYSSRAASYYRRRLDAECRGQAFSDVAPSREEAILLSRVARINTRHDNFCGCTIRTFQQHGMCSDIVGSWKSPAVMFLKPHFNKGLRQT